MSGVAGYVVAINYPERGLVADWDGEVHPSFDAALAECIEANGDEWAADVAAHGLVSENVRGADYLPYALTLAVSA